MLLASIDASKANLSDGEVVMEQGIVPTVTQGSGQFRFLISQKKGAELQGILAGLSIAGETKP
jgi:hypothetical protein